MDIVIPLICLTQKDIPWKFDSSCYDAFNSLKKIFTSTPILIHWILDTQLIMETDALDYALTAILSICNKENEVHPVAFHFHTFTVVELNYDMYNKELLTIFEAFKIWQHYLEGLAYPINIVTDHKNLEYFSTTKILTWRQAWWSKYLSQFNLVIRFCLGCLGTKLDALTKQWDIYSKERNILWQSLDIKFNSNTSNKSLNRISSGDYKRTQQGVSARLLFYLYKLHMVHATNNDFCPNIHVLSISILYVHYEVAIQLTCFLVSFI